MKRLMCGIALFMWVTHAFAQDFTNNQNNTKLITVTGKGRCEVIATLAEATFKMTVYGTNLDSLKMTISNALTSIEEHLKDIPKDKITFIKLPLGMFAPSDELDGKPRMTKSILINFKDVKILNKVVEICNKYGFYIDNQMTWRAEDENALREKAKREACRDAKNSAELVAQELGMKIVRANSARLDSAGNRFSLSLCSMEFLPKIVSESDIDVQSIVFEHSVTATFLVK